MSGMSGRQKIMARGVNQALRSLIADNKTLNKEDMVTIVILEACDKKHCNNIEEIDHNNKNTFSYSSNKLNLFRKIVVNSKS